MAARIIPYILPYILIRRAFLTRVGTSLLMLAFLASAGGCFRILHPLLDAPDPGSVEDDGSLRWRTAVALGSPSATVSSQERAVAISPNGNHEIIAYVGDQGVYVDQAHTGAWTHPTSAADTVSAGGSTWDYLSVAANDAGEVVVTWRQDGFAYFAERRSGVWQPAVQLNAFNIATGTVRLAMNSSGYTLVAWQGRIAAGCGGSWRLVYASRYVPGSGWVHPSSACDSISDHTGYSPIFHFQNVALWLDEDNTAIAAYLMNEPASDEYLVYLATFDGNSTWTAPATNQASAISPVASFDHLAVTRVSSGDIAVVYSFTNGATRNLFSSVYHASGANWTIPTALSQTISLLTRDVDSNSISLTKLADDTVFLVYRMKDSLGDFRAFVSRFASGAWTPPASSTDFVSPNLPGQVSEIVVGANSTGARLLFVEDDYLGELTLYQLDYANGAWSAPSSAVALTATGEAPSAPRFKLADTGEALLFVNQGVGTPVPTYREFR